MTDSVGTTGQLRRVLGFRDLLLFYVVTSFSLRWVATAAAAGPSALVIWLIAALGLFVPLAAFITGWTYWGSNLPYLPGLLYFAAANALFIGGDAWQPLASHPAYFIVFALAGLTIAAAMNIVGLDVGKWLNNVG